MSTSVFIVAAERSGDDLGAGLINELKTRSPDSVITGIGGASMAAAGVQSDFDISPLSILGFTEGLKAYPTVLSKVKEATELILAANTDGVVLIDSWGFMMRLAHSLRKHGYKGRLIKYVAPQVWAMREGRSKVLAEGVDHLMTIHSFDAPYFERHGLPVTYVGNPMFDTDYSSGNGSDIRKGLEIDGDSKVVAVLFGSRPSEIERLAAPFAKAISKIKSKMPDTVFVSPVSVTIADKVREAVEADKRLGSVILCPEKDKFDVFAAADAALACSGTVTTQLACAGVPTVVAYRLSPVTFFFAKRLFKANYISLVNIAADAPLMPEFVQGDCNGRALSKAVLSYISDSDFAQDTSNQLVAQTMDMKGEGGSASARAAETVLDLLEE